MGLFGNGQSGPTKLNGVRITQSKQGYAVPVVLGANKIQQSLIWLNSLSSQEVSSGGGGGGKGGGKGGGDEYLYSADVITALCAGQVAAVGNVWSNQTWLANSYANESYALTGTSYTPVYATTLVADNGVAIATTYSGSYTDYGAPAATVLGGSNYSPLTLVPYVNSSTISSLTATEYTFNPANNTYYFASSNIGRTVQVWYQYSLTQFMQQEAGLVTSSLVIYPGGNLGPQFDYGVVYCNNGNSLDGKALTAVSGTPTQAGTYSFTSGGTSSAPEYQFATGDIGNEVLITWSYQNLNAVESSAPTTLNYELYGGSMGQYPAPYVSNDESLGYTGISYLLFSPMSLGSGAEIQDNVFEVITYDGYGGGIVDCNPVACVYKVLTNPMWGLGSGQVPFPSSVIDAVTWGSSGTAGTQSVNSTAWNWFSAQNFFISPIIDSQDTAASTIGKWLEAGMCAAFMSEGLLKLVPYGDTSTAGNGCTWVAPSESVVSLDDACFVVKDGEDPVKIERSAWQDASNKVQVQFKNRSNQYSDEVVAESDQAAINRYGLRLEDPQDWDFITTLPAATFAASMRVKRSVNIRNTYTFTVPFTYSYLEPMDIVNITTSSLWAVGSNNLNLGITTLPVRIAKVVDDPKNGLEVTCEDYLWGVHQPSIYNKDISRGTSLVNAYAQPGNSEVVMFEATQRLTQYQGNQIWIGAAGQLTDWGSCNVWVSQDGTKYLQVGSITQPARLGTLASALTVTADPDTTANLVVQLANNCAPLESGTSLDANSGNTMCFVDGEIINYSTCALTGNATYTMSGYLRRGQMGSTIGAHAAGSLFMRLDGSVLKYTYDPTWKGQTLYFKFQSVNGFGNCAQELSTLTAVPFTVPGLNPGTIDAATGIVTINSSAGMNNLSLAANQTVLFNPSTSTSSTLTISIPAQSLLRTNGTALTVPAASQTFTGLAASTSYYFFPYISAATGALAFANPTPPLTSTTNNSIYAATCSSDGNYPATADYILLTTGSAINPTGGGGSTGDGTCPESQELVTERTKGVIKAIDVQAGDYLKGKCFATGEDVYRRVVHVRRQEAAIWRMVDGHRVSPCEPIWHEGAWKAAFRATGSTIDRYNGIRMDISLDSDSYNEQNYYLSDGTSLLIHNMLMRLC